MENDTSQNKKPRLAIISTHPIQYNAPFFRLLTERGKVLVKVFYTWEQSQASVFDPDFKRQVSWDIPLLEGYKYEFVKNISRNPGSGHFLGIDNPDIIDKINKWAPDFILVYGWAFSGHLKVLRHFYKKIPILFRGDSTLLDESKTFSVKKIIKSILLRWVYTHVSAAFYTGTENKKYYLKFGLKPDQLIFAPHAVDNERFFSGYENIDSGNLLRKQLAIPPGDTVFLFCGKFQPKKDPAILIQAFNKVQVRAAHLVLAGDGILKDELIVLAKPNKNIHFLPFQNQSQMPGLYQLCDVFILPSKGPGETWGLAINEAMAAGKAIVSTNKAGASFDLIKQNENGFLFQAGNSEELILILQKFINNGALAKTLGNESFTIIKKWNFTVQAEAYESFLIGNFSPAPRIKCR